jgi:hypothetical protein
LFRRDGYIRLVEDLLNEASRERDRLQKENAELTRENVRLGEEIGEIDEAIAVLREHQKQREVTG